MLFINFNSKTLYTDWLFCILRIINSEWCLLQIKLVFYDLMYDMLDEETGERNEENRSDSAVWNV